MDFWKTLSYSDGGMVSRLVPFLVGIIVGGALCRFFWKSGLKYPLTLIGVFFIGAILAIIPATAVMGAFSDESINTQRLQLIGDALTSYHAYHGSYPPDLESLVPRHLGHENRKALYMKGGKGLIWGYVPASHYKTLRPSQVVLYGPILVKGQGIILHRDGLATSYSEEKFKALLPTVLPDTHPARD